MAEAGIALPFPRKYRPPKLTDYIGNDKVKDSALSALRGKVKPQTILLEGSSGCGKTSFARLFAKEYRCEHRDDYHGACCECDNCVEMEEYILTGNTDSLSDIKEVDIADSSGKRDIDKVLEEASYPSFGGGWKVYIFDECHMASPQAQNRMLKIAEEPPEHVLFIFCTTNPEDMIETLVNRCQLRLRVTKPSVKDLSTLLRTVCLKESAEFDMKGLSLVSSRSDLTIRKALSMLEQIINEKSKATYSAVLESLDEVSDTILFDFFRKLLNRDVLGYITLVHQVRTKMELKEFVSNLLDFTNRGVYILNNVPLDGITEGELKSYKSLFSQFSVEELGVLMAKLLDLNSTDVETKLLLMGYTGLSSEATQVAKSDSVDVDFMQNEVSLERAQNLKNTEASFQVPDDGNTSNASELTKPLSVEDILSMCGGSIVKE